MKSLVKQKQYLLEFKFEKLWFVHYFISLFYYFCSCLFCFFISFLLLVGTPFLFIYNKGKRLKFSRGDQFPQTNKVKGLMNMDQMQELHKNVSNAVSSQLESVILPKLHPEIQVCVIIKFLDLLAIIFTNTKINKHK